MHGHGRHRNATIGLIAMAMLEPAAHLAAVYRSTVLNIKRQSLQL
jgi:hypothetical protein